MKGHQFINFALIISAFSTIAFSLPHDVKFPKGRIVGGSDAEPGQFPSSAAFICEDLFCGGALISPRWVLTAAYCIYYCEESLSLVQLGSPSLRLEDENRVTVISRKSIMHPDYDPSVFWSNIGLVYLEEDVEYNDYIQPIGLHEGDFLQAGDKVTITGWGSSDPEDAFGETSILQYGTANIMTVEDCEAFYGFATNTSMCTGSGATPCWRDYGSPAIVTNSEGGQEVAGVFAYKKDVLKCVEPENYPGSFTRVDFFVDWIRNVTGITDL